MGRRARIAPQIRIQIQTVGNPEVLVTHIPGSFAPLVCFRLGRPLFNDSVAHETPIHRRWGVRRKEQALGFAAGNAYFTFSVFFSQAIISGFQCSISGARQPLIPWPPSGIVIRSQTAPTLCISWQKAVDCSYTT